MPPGQPSGYGVQTKHITKILKQLGHQVAISAYYGLKSAPIKYDGIWVYPSDNWGAYPTPYYYKEYKADILISLQDLWVLPKDYGLFSNWYPYFPIDHEPVPPEVLVRLKYTRKPIAMSLFGQRELKRLGIDCYYVPHGVDTKIFKPGHGLDNFGDNFVVGLVGTNRGSRKNIQESIIAFSKFHSRHSDTVFYLHSNIVDGAPGINLKELCRTLGLQDCVFFPKQEEYNLGLSSEELTEVYNSFDVFLLPSSGEGFGIPIIEAQACGIPVIVCNFTAMPELVGGGWILKDLQKRWTYQNSWWVEPSIDEIVDCLEQAYQMSKDGSIVVLKERAREKALEYDWDNLVSMWDDILKDIEKQPKSKSLEGVQGNRLMLIPHSIEPKRVLDIGCGLTMPYKIHLEKLGEYVGVDIQEGHGIIRADACNLPFGNQEFGFVWCSEIIEHIDTPQLAVNEAKRVGRHGVIMFPTPDNPYFKLDNGHAEVKLDEEFMINQEGNGIIIW